MLRDTNNGGFKEEILKNVAKTSIYDTLAGIHSATIFWYQRYKNKNDRYARQVLKLIKEHWKEHFRMSEVTAV